jgi:hypothetical protein
MAGHYNHIHGSGQSQERLGVWPDGPDGPGGVPGIDARDSIKSAAVPVPAQPPCAMLRASWAS